METIKKISLENKVGIIRRKRPFRLIMKLYITVRKLQMSSITSLFLLDTIWQTILLVMLTY